MYENEDIKKKKMVSIEKDKANTALILGKQIIKLEIKQNLVIKSFAGSLVLNETDEDHDATEATQWGQKIPKA